MDHKISQLSIKQRLRQAKSDNKLPHHLASPASKHKIYVPEQYNCFSRILDKEIKHEGNILHRIKQQIQDFRLRRKSKVKIKNSYEYDHKSFGPSPLKKPPRSYNRKQQFTQIQSMNVSRRPSKNKQSDKIIFSNVTHFFDQNKYYETHKQAPCFKRSGVTTPVAHIQQAELQLRTQMNSALLNKQNQSKKSIKSKAVSKTDQFSITGSRPEWKNFESYHRTQLKYVNDLLK